MGLSGVLASWLTLLAIITPGKAEDSAVPTYDLARDFSTTSNPNGVWTFGWANIGSPLVPFTYFTHDTAGPATVDVWAKPGGYYPAIEKNNSSVVGTSDGGQGTYPPGSVWFYPGQEGTPQNYGVIRFTTPAGGAGTYRLLSNVRSYLSGPSSGDTDFHILKNGAELFGKFLPPSSAASYSGDLVLASGDIIDFIVGRGADDLLYGSGLFINATLNLTSGGGVAPMIATQPQNQTVTAGANVTFTVTANGTAPLSYQWLFNATPISGATSSSLTISNAQPANAGNYSVRVSNASGSVTSAVARLTVQSSLTCVQSPPG